MFYKSKFLKQNITLIVVCLFCFNLSNVYAQELSFILNEYSVQQEDSIVIYISNGSPSGIVTLWVINEEDVLVWAVQDNFLLNGTFEYNFTVPITWESGEYSVYIRDVSAGNERYDSVNIGDISPGVKDFELSELKILPMEVESNEEVQVSIVVTNVGDIAGDYDVELKLDDALYDSEQVLLDAGSSTTVDFTVISDAVGTHIVAIGDLFEVFQVIEPSSGGFEIPTIVLDLGIIVIVAGAIFLLRRYNVI